MDNKLSLAIWWNTTQEQIFFLSFLFFIFLATLQGMQDLSSSDHQGSNRGPLQWKHGVLTTGLPGNS